VNVIELTLAQRLIYTIGIYHWSWAMADTGTAKIFMHGPQPGGAAAEGVSPAGQGGARAPRVGRGVLLEPLEFDVDAWLGNLAKDRDIPFMEEGREQPPMPEDDRKYFDE
jgi:antitoxin VapB